MEASPRLREKQPAKNFHRSVGCWYLQYRYLKWPSYKALTSSWLIRPQSPMDLARRAFNSGYISEFRGLWVRNQETLVVIWVSVWVFKKLFVLLDRHHVARVVDEVLFDCGGGDTSEGQGAAECHT